MRLGGRMGGRITAEGRTENMQPCSLIPHSQRQTQLAPAMPPQPEGYSRSPTLLVGATPGGHGEVRVWSPSKRNLRLRVAYICGSTALSIIPVYYFFHGDLISLIVMAIFLMILPLAPYWMASKRPCYLTTDDNGIGVTTYDGSRAFRWTDIRAIKWAEESLFSLEVNREQPGETPEQVILNLGGYPLSVKREFISLVITKAQLQPHKKSVLLLYPSGSRSMDDSPALRAPRSGS